MGTRNIGQYFIFALMFSAPAFAGTVNINGVNIQANTADKYIKSQYGGYIRNVHFEAQVASSTTPNPNPIKYSTRAVAYTNNTLGKSIKGFAKNNAYQLGLATVIIGMGWFLDEITGQIYPQPTDGSTPATTCNPSFTASGFVSATTSCSISGAVSAHLAKCNTYVKTTLTGDSRSYCVFPSASSVGTHYPNIKFFGYDVYNPSGYWGDTGGGLSIAQTGTYNQPATPPTATPATDEAVGASVMPQLDSNPQLQNKIGTDPSTGAIDLNQQVLDKMTEIANEVAKQNDPNSTPVSAPVATDPNTQTDPEAITANQTFCAYAQVVCDFIDWVKTPSDEPPNADWKLSDNVTTNEIQPVNYSSGIGTGTCPSPANISVLGASLEYSYQPICDLAGVARIFVLLFAYLSSGYILLGVRR